MNTEKGSPTKTDEIKKEGDRAKNKGPKVDSLTAVSTIILNHMNTQKEATNQPPVILTPYHSHPLREETIYTTTELTTKEDICICENCLTPQCRDHSRWRCIEDWYTIQKDDYRKTSCNFNICSECIKTHRFAGHPHTLYAINTTIPTSTKKSYARNVA